jgi:hypothetical protein
VEGLTTTDATLRSGPCGPPDPPLPQANATVARRAAVVVRIRKVRLMSILDAKGRIAASV